MKYRWHNQRGEPFSFSRFVHSNKSFICPGYGLHAVGARIAYILRQNTFFTTSEFATFRHKSVGHYSMHTFKSSILSSWFLEDNASLFDNAFWTSLICHGSVTDSISITSLTQQEYASGCFGAAETDRHAHPVTSADSDGRSQCILAYASCELLNILSRHLFRYVIWWFVHLDCFHFSNHLGWYLGVLVYHGIALFVNIENPHHYTTNPVRVLTSELFI